MSLRRRLRCSARHPTPASLTEATRRARARTPQPAAPGAPPLAGLDYQTLCAGELSALTAGLRGVAMVQLAMG
jgi:hypothetical protein